jgi:WD40 repeat protein
MIVLKSGLSKLRIDEVAFSPDGSLIDAPAASQGICLWPSFADSPKAEILQLPIVTSRLAFAPDGKTLFAGNDRLSAVSLPDRTVVGKCPIDPPMHPLWFGVSPDGSRVVVAEEYRSQQTSRFRAWDSRGFGTPVWEVTGSGQVWSRPMFAPDGETFATCENLLTGNVWRPHRGVRSVATGERLDLSAPLDEAPDQAVRSPDGAVIAWRIRGAIHIYPMTEASASVVVQNEGKSHFTGVAFHPTGRLLAATSNDATVKLYDAQTWKHVRTFTWDIGRMRSVAFSPDGTLAAAGGDRGKVVVWDVDV